MFAIYVRDQATYLSEQADLATDPPHDCKSEPDQVTDQNQFASQTEPNIVHVNDSQYVVLDACSSSSSLRAPKLQKVKLPRNIKEESIEKPVSNKRQQQCSGVSRYLPQHSETSDMMDLVKFLARRELVSSGHHLQLNLAKTELLVFPATPTLHHDFTIQLGSSTITPSASVRNLGVIFDGQLTFKEHIAKTARSCRFALHNIRKIRPFLTEHAAQLLVQALVISRLDYCNALLAGLPSNTIKPLQMIQNAAPRLVFNEPKRAHVTPLFVSLHWLPVAALIQFKTLMLAYRTTTGSAPIYFHSLLRIYIPSRSLRSASERRLVVPSQRGSKSLSRTFSFTVPGWWNDLPTPIRNAGSLSNFKQQLKTHLFQLYLTT